MKNIIDNVKDSLVNFVGEKLVDFGKGATKDCGAYVLYEPEIPEELLED